MKNTRTAKQRKFGLHKETLRTLTGDQLEDVRGGLLECEESACTCCCPSHSKPH